jgi:hypothetical protein
MEGASAVRPILFKPLLNVPRTTETLHVIGRQHGPELNEKEYSHGLS